MSAAIKLLQVATFTVVEAGIIPAVRCMRPLACAVRAIKVSGCIYSYFDTAVFYVQCGGEMAIIRSTVGQFMTYIVLHDSSRCSAVLSRDLAGGEFIECEVEVLMLMTDRVDFVHARFIVC